MSHCILCRITGRVQGVWFRGSTQQQALRLGLTGYAKNLADGRVEVVACGEEVAIVQLHEWLWQGPKGAAVVDVACEPLAESGDYSSFTTA
jgi:acylphosphatase